MTMAAALAMGFPCMQPDKVRPRPPGPAVAPPEAATACLTASARSRRS